jgi:hypothetical protein
MTEWQLVVRYEDGGQWCDPGRNTEYLKKIARQAFRPIVHGYMKAASDGDPIAVIVDPGGTPRHICRPAQCGWRLRWLWIPGEPGEEWGREWKRRGYLRG